MASQGSRGTHAKRNKPPKAEAAYMLAVDVAERTKELEKHYSKPQAPVEEPEVASPTPARPPKKDHSSDRPLPAPPSDNIYEINEAVSDDSTSLSSCNCTDDSWDDEEWDNHEENEQTPYFSTPYEDEYDIGGGMNKETSKKLALDIRKRDSELLGLLTANTNLPVDDMDLPRRSQSFTDGNDGQQATNVKQSKTRKAESDKGRRMTKYLKDLKPLHENFNKELTELYDNWEDASSLGNLLLRNIEGMRTAYRKYISTITKVSGKMKVNKEKNKEVIADLLAPLKYLSWLERTVIRYFLSLTVPCARGEQLKGVNEENKTVREMLGRLTTLNKEIESSSFIQLLFGKEFQKPIRLVGFLHYAHPSRKRQLQPNPLTAKKKNDLSAPEKVDPSFEVLLVNHYQEKETKPIFKFDDCLVIAHTIPTFIDKNSYICVHFRSVKNLAYSGRFTKSTNEVTIKVKDKSSGVLNTDIVLQGNKQMLDAIVEGISVDADNESQNKATGQAQQSANRRDVPPAPPMMRCLSTKRSTSFELNKFAKTPDEDKSSKQCACCENPFVKFGKRTKRKCKGCGKAVCSVCCANKIYLPHTEFNADYVCPECFQHAKTYLPHLKCPDSKRAEKARKQTAISEHMAILSN